MLPCLAALPSIQHALTQHKTLVTLDIYIIFLRKLIKLIKVNLKLLYKLIYLKVFEELIYLKVNLKLL